MTASSTLETTHDELAPRELDLSKAQQGKYYDSTAITMLQRYAAAGEPLTIDQIDECILEFESSQRLFAAAKAAHDEAKQQLIQIVQAHGSTPAGAGQSTRIVGRRNNATVTVGTTTTVNEEEIRNLAEFLSQVGKEDVFYQLFATEIKHKLIDGARNVVGAITLPKRVHDKVLSLFGRCFDVKPKAPALKVDVIVPEKPARKARAKKGGE